MAGLASVCNNADAAKKAGTVGVIYDASSFVQPLAAFFK
jgi:hypothetical protein